MYTENFDLDYDYIGSFNTLFVNTHILKASFMYNKLVSSIIFSLWNEF